MDLMATLGPLLGGFGVGAGGALVTAGKWAKDAKDNSEEALRLLKGSDEIDGDGVIEIVEDNRRIARSNRRAIRASDAVPNPDRYE